MQTATRNEVDEVLQEESHQGDTFAKVRVENETGWVQIEG